MKEKEGKYYNLFGYIVFYIMVLLLIDPITYYDMISDDGVKVSGRLFSLLLQQIDKLIGQVGLLSLFGICGIYFLYKHLKAKRTDYIKLTIIITIISIAMLFPIDYFFDYLKAQGY